MQTKGVLEMSLLNNLGTNWYSSVLTEKLSSKELLRVDRLIIRTISSDEKKLRTWLEDLVGLLVSIGHSESFAREQIVRTRS